MFRNVTSLARFAPVLLAFAGGACGGGGGGGGGTGGSDTLNEGVYDVTSFGYVDPKPQSYQPFTKPTFAAVRCDEVAVLVGDADKSFEVDDKKTYDANGISYPKIPSEATAGLSVIQAIHPDIDGDGRPDLVVLGRVGASGSAILRVNILTFVNAQWVKIGTFDCNTAGDHFENESATISYGDVDGDGREEIIVAATLDTDSWVRVYEDPIQGAGFGVIAKEFALADTTDVRAIAAQLDDDGEYELVVYTHPHAGTPAVYVLDDAQKLYAPLMSTPLFAKAGLTSVELVAIQRDDDSRDEIAVIGRESTTSLVVRIFDDAVAGFPLIKAYDSVNPGNWAPVANDNIRRAQAGDIDGDGVEELVVLTASKSNSTYTLNARVHWGNGTVTTKPYTFTTSVLKSWDLALADRDSDGKRELVVGYEATASASGVTNLYVNVQQFDANDPTKLSLQFGSVPFPLSGPQPLVLAGDDFDMDGVRMRWKGVKFQQLPDPTLIVVLAAPPTKKGISQNYGGSEMSYSTSQGYSTSYEVTRTKTLSLSGGFEAEDPTGWNGGGFKVTVGSALSISEGGSDSISTSVSFTGGYDQDVVIFEGTLHMIYVYEFVAAANPALIGTEVSINIPIQTKLYKWTRTFFEDTFGAKSPIPADLLTHTIGSPASYPRHSDVQSILESNEGFEGDTVTVGQGKGSNGLGLSMESCITVGTSWSWELSFEAEGKIAGITFGFARSMSGEHAFTASTTKGTDYEGKIGDIQQAGDYFTWGYDTGIYIYRHEQQGKDPFQVLGFWTDPWGSGY